MYPHGYTWRVIEVIQTEHFRRWIDRLRDRSVRARILARIIAVEEGHFGDWKAIDRTVSELRVHAGPGYRVYSPAAAIRSSSCSQAATSGPSAGTSKWRRSSQPSFGTLRSQTNDR